MKTTTDYRYFRTGETRVTRKFVGACARTGRPFRHFIAFTDAAGRRSVRRIPATEFHRLALMATRHGNRMVRVQNGDRVYVDFDA